MTLHGIAADDSTLPQAEENGRPVLASMKFLDGTQMLAALCCHFNQRSKMLNIIGQGSIFPVETQRKRGHKDHSILAFLA